MRTVASSLVLGVLGVVVSACASGGGAGGQTTAPLSVRGSSEGPGPDVAGEASEDAPRDDYGSRSSHGETAWVGGAAGSAYMLAGAHEELVGFWVDLPADKLALHVPTALALSIDMSGSMQGEKIAHARDAAQRLVDALADGDYVSLVGFSDQAQVIVGATVVTPHSRDRLKRAIGSLTAAGGTALEQGVATAMHQFEGVPSTHLVKRAVVISDGQATIGSTDPSVIGQIAARRVPEGIQVTSVGVGLDYDESILNALAVRSSGRLYHVENSSGMAEVIDAEMRLLKNSVAARGVLELVPAPGVSLSVTANTDATRQGENLIIPVGTLYAGQRREFLLAARVQAEGRGQAEAVQQIASVRLHYDDPTADGLRRVRESVVTSRITADPGLVEKFAESRTQELIAMHDAAALTMVASEQATAGNLEMAQQQLQDAQTQLLRHAQKAKSEPAKQRLERQAKKLGSASANLGRASHAAPAARDKAARSTALDLNDDAMEAYGF